MVHKLIKKVTEEYIEPKDDEEVKKILGKTEKKDEKETDIMDDYDSGMWEFLDSMRGTEEKDPAKKKTSEIRALGD
jgi:hypothetical protein